MERIDYEKIMELVEERKYAAVRRELMELHPVDIAEIFSELDHKVLPVVFRLLPKETAAETFVELDSEHQEALIQGFSDAELKNILSELFVDDTVDILEEMPANVVQRMLRHSSPETRKELNELLKYPDDSAGGLMTTEYVSLKEGMTVEDAFIYIKKTGIDSETIYNMYVTDSQRKLLGMVSIRQLIFAERNQTIGELMDDNVISVTTLEDKETVANMFSKYDLSVMPVVDGENRVVGIITVDDAVDVLVEEATEDMQLMSAVVPIEESYFDTSIIKHWSKRIVWLLFLMLSGVATGLIIDHYEGLIATLPLLVAFIPRLMGTGGNCGSQSSTMIIRGLALDEIRPKNIGKCILKELGIATLAGLTLAIANVGVVWVMYGGEYPADVVWSLCFAFGLTLFLVVIISKLLGCTLPILAKVCKLDPAIMASPIITTLVDITSIFIYFVVIQTFVSSLL